MTPKESLAALVARWREDAAIEECVPIAERIRLQRCADALEAAIASMERGAENPRRYERVVEALVRYCDVSQERVDTVVEALDSIFDVAGEMLDSPAFDRTRKAITTPAQSGLTEAEREALEYVEAVYAKGEEYLYVMAANGDCVGQICTALRRLGGV